MDSSFSLPYIQSSSWDDSVSRDQFMMLAVPKAREIGGTRRMRVFMPAETAHINLCKSIMSAVALGYPMPILLNRKGEFNRPRWHFAGSRIAKVESWLSAIDELLENDSDADDNDLAVLVDAYDIWFQLPPSILIKRYHQLNDEANERVRKQWEAAQRIAVDFPVPPPKQSIIVTSARACHASSKSGFMDRAGKHRIHRGSVDSGMVMGPMGSLRSALFRARGKFEQTARTGPQLWSDQVLFGDIIGDQELWREWMLELAEAWNGTASRASCPSCTATSVRSPVTLCWARILNSASALTVISELFAISAPPKRTATLFALATRTNSTSPLIRPASAPRAFRVYRPILRNSVKTLAILTGPRVLSTSCRGVMSRNTRTYTLALQQKQRYKT